MEDLLTVCSMSFYSIFCVCFFFPFRNEFQRVNFAIFTLLKTMLFGLHTGINIFYIFSVLPFLDQLAILR